MTPNNKRSAVVASLFVAAFFAVAIADAAPVPFKANVKTGGAKSATLTANIRNLDDTTDQPTLGWATNIDPSTARWVISTGTIKMTWNVTGLSSHIKIYTDNRNLTPTKFADPTNTISNNLDSNPAGLVLSTTSPTGIPAISTPYTIPVAWTVKPSKMKVDDNLLPADPNTGPATGDGNRFQWLYLLDINTPAIDTNGDTINDTTAFNALDPFVHVVRFNGIHMFQGPSDFFADPDKVSYIYFQADFNKAAAQEYYQTVVNLEAINL